MTLTQLRTLLAVADTGSVRAASEKLFVSQPAVSGALSSLERELGVELVQREGRGLRLTVAGTELVSSVREALALIDHGIRTAQSVEEPGRGSVRIAAVTTAAERLLPPLLAGFRRQYPEAHVTVGVGNRTTMWDALRDGDADLVVAGRPATNRRVRVLGRAENRLIVVGPVRRGAMGPAGSKRVWPAAEALGPLTWLLREEGSGTRIATDELLAEIGVDPPRMILGSNGAVEQAAIAGLGVGLISTHAVAESLSEGRLAVYECPGTPLDRPWHLVARDDVPLTPTAVLAARSMLSTPGAFVPTAEGRRILQGGTRDPSRRPRRARTAAAPG